MPWYSDLDCNPDVGDGSGKSHSAFDRCEGCAHLRAEVEALDVQLQQTQSDYGALEAEVERLREALAETGCPHCADGLEFCL